MGRKSVAGRGDNQGRGKKRQRVHAEEQFITAFKLNTGVAECRGYVECLPVDHIGLPFYKGNEIGTSLTVVFQLVLMTVGD